MAKVKGATFVDRLLEHVSVRPRESVSLKVDFDEGSVTVCVGPAVTRRTRELLGMDGPRALCIEGTFKGMQFVINDPNGLGKLSKGGFCGLDVDPTGLSMQHYIGMGADDFYELIQSKIIQHLS
jgi:hypothetical protein